VLQIALWIVSAVVLVSAVFQLRGRRTIRTASCTRPSDRTPSRASAARRMPPMRVIVVGAGEVGGTSPARLAPTATR
jgi:hypothetical protein